VSPAKSGGKVHLKTALYTAAGRTKATYLGNKYHRIRAPGGPGVAAGAAAQEILITAFHILPTSSPNREFGADCLDRRAKQRIQRTLACIVSKRLAAMKPSNQSPAAKS
jgi:transposase